MTLTREISEARMHHSHNQTKTVQYLLELHFEEFLAVKPEIRGKKKKRKKERKSKRVSFSKCATHKARRIQMRINTVLLQS